MPDLVECRSDSQYAERPLALHWQAERLEVLEVLAEWRSPQGKCFRVRATNLGAQTSLPPEELIFDLCYDESTEDWQITPR